jgi:hypothetical protein
LMVRCWGVERGGRWQRMSRNCETQIGSAKVSITAAETKSANRKELRKAKVSDKVLQGESRVG